VPQIMPPGMTPPVTELRWDNLLLRSHRFRRAHVETLDVPGRLCVLHVCVFPPLSDATPIFGFDVVAGCARVTGIFLDLSPVVSAPDILRLRDVVHPEALAGFAIRRPPPEWGGIFSADLLAIRPSGLDEVRRAIDLARQALDAVLMAPPQAAGSAGEAAAGQSRYIMQQRRNDHTLRLLAGFIGPEAARRFIDEVLFPPVPELHVPELPAPDLSPAGAPLPGRLFSGGPPGGPPSVGRPSGLGALGLHRMA
jgi:phycocyanobilin:ferredoxin oxidoreductase